MNDISADKKLELVKMIRAESQYNKIKMKKRESILYGTIFDKSYQKEERYHHEGEGEEALYSMEGHQEGEPYRSTFKLRFVIAALLFLSFFVLDRTQGSIQGITPVMVMEQIRQTASLPVMELLQDIGIGVE